MRLKTILSLATLFLFWFTVSVWPRPTSYMTNAAASPGEATQTVSGKISLVGEATFAVDVKKAQDVQTMQFLIDGNTKVTGKLEVGATAMVEFRTDGDKNVAHRVIVEKAMSQNSR